MAKWLPGWRKYQTNNIQNKIMPHIQVKLLEGKSEAQKQELTKALIKAAQNVIGFGDESYSVSIEDFSLPSWKEKIYPKDIMGNETILYKTPGYNM